MGGAALSWLVNLGRAVVSMARGDTTGQSDFQGAQQNRLTWDWVTQPLSVDDRVRRSLRRLRARSRSLVRNNGYAQRFVRMVERNVVGKQGIQLRGNVRTENGEPDEEANQAVEREWKRWSKPENCTVDGRLSWRGVQKSAIGSVAGDGEFLARMVFGFENSEHRFGIQLLDPDQLDHRLNRRRGRDGRGGVQNEIRMGVEVDKWGRPVAYHVYDHHPRQHHLTRGDLERVRIPAEQIIHLFVPIPGRVNQTRGIPWLAPTMLDLKMLGGYQEAELVAARAAAAKMGFFTHDPTYGSGWTAPEPGEEDFTVEAEPGTFEQLPPGMKFMSWDPQHPNAAFGDFTKGVLRAVAAGCDVSYNALSNDLESVNFTSLRDGRQEERDGWVDIQQWLVTHLNARVYPQWLRFAVLTGALDDVGAVTGRRFQDPTWLARGWDWVDPLKEIKAQLLALEGGLTSRTKIAAERGDDFAEILEQLAKEEEMADEAGLEFLSLAEMVMDQQGGGGQSDRSALELLLTEGEHHGDDGPEPGRNGRSSGTAPEAVPFSPGPAR